MKDVNYVPGTFERNPSEAMITGVCAAVAKRLGWNKLAVRIVSLVLLLNFTLVAGLAYIGLTLSIPKKNGI